MKGKNPPTILKIISVLYYIAAAFLLIFPVILLLAGFSFAGLGSLIGLGLGFALLLITVPFAVLAFFIARGLWRGQKWSRIVVIILSVLAVISGIASLSASGIINIVVEGLIAVYLIFSKDVKAYFK